jgi:integrase
VCALGGEELGLGNDLRVLLEQPPPLAFGYAAPDASFGKSVTTLIDDAGLSARIGADQLGHARVSMTQDCYMRRGEVHAEVAALFDRHKR